MTCKRFIRHRLHLHLFGLGAVLLLVSPGLAQPPPPIAPPSAPELAPPQTRPRSTPPRPSNRPQYDISDTPPDPYAESDGAVDAARLEVEQRIERLLRQALNQHTMEANRELRRLATENRLLADQARIAIREARDEAMRAGSREQRIGRAVARELRARLLAEYRAASADPDSRDAATLAGTITSALERLQPLDVYQSIRVQPTAAGGELVILSFQRADATVWLEGRLAEEFRLHGIALDDTTSSTMQRAISRSIQQTETLRLADY